MFPVLLLGISCHVLWCGVYHQWMSLVGLSGCGPLWLVVSRRRRVVGLSHSWLVKNNEKTEQQKKCTPSPIGFGQPSSPFSWSLLPAGGSNISCCHCVHCCPSRHGEERGHSRPCCCCNTVHSYTKKNENLFFEKFETMPSLVGCSDDADVMIYEP